MWGLRVPQSQTFPKKGLPDIVRLELKGPNMTNWMYFGTKRSRAGMDDLGGIGPEITGAKHAGLPKYGRYRIADSCF